MRFLPTKRFWLRLAIGLAILVAIGLILNGLMIWRTDSQLQARLAAIREAGDPASVAELAPTPIPDEENAAAILERIAPRIREFASAQGRFSNTVIGKAYDEAGDRGEPATKEQIDAIRVIIDMYPDVDQGLAAAAKCDKYASRLDFTLNSNQFIEQLIERQGLVRQGGRYLNWRIEVLLAEGKHEEALRRGIEIYRLARLYEAEPGLVPFLVAIAVRGLAADQIYDALSAGPVSPELLAELDAELALMDTPERLVHAIKSDRAVSSGWTADLPGPPSLWLANAVGWPIKSYLIGAIDYSGENLRLAEKPWHEVRDRFGPADSPASPTAYGVLADLLQPAMRAVGQANARSLAVLRALRIYIALRQFAEKNGREANGLEELELPPAVTIDPYSGQPLKLKPTDEGWMIYSVMTNGMDDGGDFKGHKDFGVAPPKRRLVE